MKFFLLIFCLLSVCSCAVPGESMETLRDPRTGKNTRYAGDQTRGNRIVQVPKKFVLSPSFLRGVWVATVENIDFPKSSSPEEFKRNYRNVISNLRRINCNAVFFQVRPCNDAFYRSKINPFSVYFAGKQGKSFGYFDPMQFMVEEAHRQGLAFHAWLNPYRVSTAVPMTKQTFLKTLAPGNFAARNPELLLAIPSGKKNLMILDPGNPKTIRHMIDTVNEIIRNYKVDGIHMDDYFYPYEGIGNADRRSFQLYNRHHLDPDSWRRYNTDLLVYNLSKNIREYNRKMHRNIQFGISPFGIWANASTNRSGSPTKGSESYKIQHADTRKWVKNNWVDYIVPQLYWTFGHRKAPYAALADWWGWTVRGTKVKLYIGHSAARLGTNAEWSSSSELYDQIRYNSMNAAISGSVLFSYRSLFAPSNRVMKNGTEKVIRIWRSVPVGRR